MALPEKGPLKGEAAEEGGRSTGEAWISGVVSNMRQAGSLLTVQTALATVDDRSLAIEDRAAAYALLHQVQLRVNRRLREAKDDLIAHLQAHDLRELGPLYLRSSAVDVRFECNDPANFGDAGVQDAMRELAGNPRFAEWVREVPHHYEINSAELGAAVAQGHPAARELHAEMKRRGWRTDAGRRWSLAVREVREAA